RLSARPSATPCQLRVDDLPPSIDIADQVAERHRMLAKHGARGPARLRDPDAVEGEQLVGVEPTPALAVRKSLEPRELREVEPGASVVVGATLALGRSPRPIG